MSENRCECGGLRHKHDIERIAALEAKLADYEVAADEIAAFGEALSMRARLEAMEQLRAAAIRFVQDIRASYPEGLETLESVAPYIHALEDALAAAQQEQEDE